MSDPCRCIVPAPVALHEGHCCLEVMTEDWTAVACAHAPEWAAARAAHVASLDDRAPLPGQETLP